jgi:hypothetical protein
MKIQKIIESLATGFIMMFPPYIVVYRVVQPRLTIFHAIAYFHAGQNGIADQRCNIGQNQR